MASLPSGMPAATADGGFFARAGGAGRLILTIGLEPSGVQYRNGAGTGASTAPPIPVTDEPTRRRKNNCGICSRPRRATI
jgi:hypothetical protein